MTGTPNLIHIDGSSHDWCFPSLPAVLNARTVEGIRAALVEMTDPAARRTLGAAARDWYDRHHSLDVVCARLIDSLMASEANEFAAEAVVEGAHAGARRLASGLQRIEAVLRAGDRMRRPGRHTSPMSAACTERAKWSATNIGRTPAPQW